jgi:Zn-dependent peptidase ImmA (M78 family)
MIQKEIKNMEKEANQIAAELLMPEFAVRSKVEEEGLRIEEIATHFGVPESVMAIRLINLGYNILEQF